MKIRSIAIIFRTNIPNAQTFTTLIASLNCCILAIRKTLINSPSQFIHLFQIQTDANQPSTSREPQPGTSSGNSGGGTPVKDVKKRTMQPFESLLAAIGNKASGKLDVKGAVSVRK